MFIVLRPIRCEMKPQKITDKPQQGSVMTWYQTTSWLFLLQEIFNSLWVSQKKIFFDHKPTPVTWFRLLKNQSTEQTQKWVQIVKIYNGTGPRHGWRFLSYKKIRIKNHQSQLTSMTFWTVCETNTGKHDLWLAHFFFYSQTRCLAVSDPVFLMNFAFP